MRLVVFTDLDGTLLEHDTYSWLPARPALDALRARGHAVVLTTSKTRAEITRLRNELGNQDPFIVENGGGIFIPGGYFGRPVEGAVEIDGLDAILLGAPYHSLLAALRECSLQTGVPVRGFSQMPVEELSRRTGLPAAIAALSARREFVEPFAVENDADPAPLLHAIEARGLQWTRGGRFFHILGGSDKARAVRRLARLFRESQPVQTVGLGDAENDAGFLLETDVPIVVRGHRAHRLAELVPLAPVTSQPGPAGWNEAVLALLSPPG